MAIQNILKVKDGVTKQYVKKSIKKFNYLFNSYLHILAQ